MWRNDTIFCCDIDNVLADLDGPLLDRIARDLEIVIPEIAEWHALERHLAPVLPDAREWLDQIFADPAFLRELPLMLPMLRVLQQVRGMVQSIHIVTARPPTTQEITRYWLDCYGIPYDKFVMTQEKAEYCRSKRARYIVEDAPHHAEQCLDIGVGVFLIDKPYNRHLAARGGLWRIHHPMEIPDLLAADLAERI